MLRQKPEGLDWQSSSHMAVPRLEEINLLHASFCRALSEPKRILILYALKEKPRHVSALAEYLNIPQPTVSRHLRILRNQSLVRSEREGSAVIYYLADYRIIEVLEVMRQILCDSLTHRTDLLQSPLTLET
jgi:ArsR family transcriptional regulator